MDGSGSSNRDMSRTPPLPSRSLHALDDQDANVLVVDDDEDLADTYTLWLDDQVAVHTAYDGLAALDLVAERSVDGVILDRRMPSLSGDEVLEAMRDRGHDVPVALVSAVEPTLDVLDLAFDAYLVKPVGRERVVSAVETLLGLAGVPDVVREYATVHAKLMVLETGPRYRTDPDPPALADLRERATTLRDRAADALGGGATGGTDPVDVTQIPDER